MYEGPQEPPSGLGQELAAESQSSLPSPDLRLLPVGTAVAFVGFLLAAFYTWAVPLQEPLEFRALLNAGLVLVALGLALISFGLLRIRGERARSVSAQV